MRLREHGGAAARSGGKLVVICLLALFLSIACGCAVFHRRGGSTEQVAAARELSRQGVAALETGQPQQAEELLKKSLAACSDDASAHRYMAEALWRRGAGGEAITQINEAIRLDPSNAELAVRAGEMFLAAGRRDAALLQAERGIHLDSRLAAAWALRGRCFLQLNQADRGLADFERAIDLAPDRSDLLLEIARIYRQRGQSARSLTAIYRLLDSYPSGEEPQHVLVMQGLSLMDLGRPQQATDVFLAAAKRGGPDADLYFHLAQSYSAAGSFTEAATAAQQALAINADHEGSRQLLSQLARRGADQTPSRH
jgi:tetratricopeptide (TPR) repeat protein